MQVPSRLQGCVTEIVPQAHPLGDTGVLDGYALHLCSNNTARNTTCTTSSEYLSALHHALLHCKVCYNPSQDVVLCCITCITASCICHLQPESVHPYRPWQTASVSTGKLNWHCGSGMPLHSTQLQLVMPCIPSWAGNQQAASLQQLSLCLHLQLSLACWRKERSVLPNLLSLKLAVPSQAVHDRSYLCAVCLVCGVLCCWSVTNGSHVVQHTPNMTLLLVIYIALTFV